MGFMAKFVCDKKPQRELEREVASLFEQLGVNAVYTLSGDTEVGFYELPNGHGAINIIYSRAGSIQIDGKPHAAVIGLGNMDTEVGEHVGNLLSGLMYDYNNE